MQGLQEHADSMYSALLRRLVTPGQGFPDPAEPLEGLLAAADWEAAAAEGRIRPTPVRAHMPLDSRTVLTQDTCLATPIAVLALLWGFIHLRTRRFVPQLLYCVTRALPGPSCSASQRALQVPAAVRAACAVFQATSSPQAAAAAGDQQRCGRGSGGDRGRRG